MNQTKLLGKKVALVTGGGRGIGRETAMGLARAGARVAVAARSSDEIQGVAEEIQRRYGPAMAVPADVADPNGIEGMMETVWEAWGRVDILVNNAGVLDPVGMVWEVSVADWLRALTVNLGGVFLCSHSWLKRVLEHADGQGRGGKIINISTGAAERAQPGCSAYCASKAGVDHFTRVLAAEVAEYGVTVNAVYPGMVDTQMMTYLREAPRSRLPEKDWFVKIWREGKLRSPAEIAQLVVWLSSHFADDLNGQIVRIDDEAIRRRVSQELW